MGKEELEEILLKFSYKEDYKEEADKAFVKLYRAYSKYLTFVVRRSKEKYYNFYDEIIHDVVNNTFLKIYEKPFNFDISSKDTYTVVDKKFKGYLSRIAKNELIDLTSRNHAKEEHKLYIDDDDLNFDPPEIKVIKELTPSENKKLLKEVLLTFSEMQRSIILELYEYHVEGKKPPKEVISRLIRIHKTTKENIRQIKHRCDKKIVEHFKKHSKLKPLKHSKLKPLKH